MKSIVTFLFLLIPLTYSLQAGTVSDLTGNPSISDVQFENQISASGPLNIHTFPNPFQNELTVELSYSDQPVQIRLFNLVGKVLIQQQTQSTMKLDVSSLPAGTYYLKVESGSESITRRVIKY